MSVLPKVLESYIIAQIDSHPHPILELERIKNNIIHAGGRQEWVDLIEETIESMKEEQGV